MFEFISNVQAVSHLWVYGNFLVYVLAFLMALYVNANFNSILVGVIYFLPLFPLGLPADHEFRFLMVSFQNTIFGIIELAIVVVTTRKTDVLFNKEYIHQLVGHTLPVAVALVGLSFVARSSMAPMTEIELILIVSLFLLGAAVRILAVYQIGLLAFKFDIAFRKEQKLKSDQLYGYVRHPSYIAMMIVVISYAINGGYWMVGVTGVLIAWIGFQYRIFHEEQALAKKFGLAYRRYQSQTPMWIPRIWRAKG